MPPYLITGQGATPGGHAPRGQGLTEIRHAIHETGTTRRDESIDVTTGTVRAPADLGKLF
jgi:hypothetical protein